MTNTPPATPPPWRPKGYPPGGGNDDPTLVDTALDDPTFVQPVPVPPPPPPPGPMGYYPSPGPMASYPPPGRHRRRWLAPLLACIGAFLGVAVVAALLSPKDPAASPPPVSAAVRPTTTARPTTTLPDDGPGSRADQPAPGGTAVTPAKGWTVAVTDVDLDANAEMAKAAWYLRPGSGKRYVLVTLAVTHQGDQKGTLFAEMKFGIRLPDGSIVRPTVNPTSDHLEIGEQLPPQGSASGTLAFEFPKGDVGKAVLVAEPMFTLDGEKDQRFLALA